MAKTAGRGLMAPLGSFRGGMGPPSRVEIGEECYSPQRRRDAEASAENAFGEKAVGQAILPADTLSSVSRRRLESRRQPGLAAPPMSNLRHRELRHQAPQSLAKDVRGGQQADYQEGLVLEIVEESGLYQDARALQQFQRPFLFAAHAGHLARDIPTTFHRQDIARRPGQRAARER